jgi:hypothetical protein
MLCSHVLGVGLIKTAQRILIERAEKETKVWGLIDSRVILIWIMGKYNFKLD